MKKAPWSPRVLALILIGVAISFPIQIMMFYGHSISELHLVALKLTSLNLLTMFFCLLCAPALWNSSQYAAPLLFVTGALVAWNNYLVGYVAYEYSFQDTLTATGMFLGTYVLLLHPNALKALLRPNSRWWMQAPRKAISLPTEIYSVSGLSQMSKTFDLSTTGAFIGFGDMPYRSLKLGDYCNLSIQITAYKKVTCLARVVRVAEETGHYPSGVGLHFENIDIKDAHFLRRAINEAPELVHH